MTSSAEAALCRDSLYPTRHIEDLPLRVHLTPPPQHQIVNDTTAKLDERKDGVSLTFDYASVRDLEDCRSMIEAATSRGDNVGTDEYERGEVGGAATLEHLVQLSEIFVGREEGGRRAKVFVFISPNEEVRSPLDTCMASVRIFYTEDLEQKEITSSHPSAVTYYQQLLRLATSWVQQIHLGYTHCCVRVAACCRQLIAVVEREGFELSVTLPRSVDIAGVGLVSDYLCMKKLDEPTKHTIRLPASVAALVSRLYPSNKVTARRYRDAQLPSVPFLPQDYVFDNGTRVTIRNVRKDEDELIYNMFKSSAEAADGYDALEYVSLDYFRAEKMLQYYCVVLEETSTGRIVGCEFAGDCVFTRSAKSGTSITSVVIAREFQNKGFGREMVLVDCFVCRQLGYVAMINDVLASNARMDRVLRHVWGDSLTDLGRIPNGAYSGRRGWDDLVIQHYPYDAIARGVTFEEFTRQSFRKHRGQSAGGVLSSAAGSGTHSKL